MINEPTNIEQIDAMMNEDDDNDDSSDSDSYCSSSAAANSGSGVEYDGTGDIDGVDMMSSV